ncbi:MAG: hypothetical protein HC850_15160, partial [Rhodomicrobium sp.]|nr:hypothetical protein [Rhodomicrobium sp.]
TTRAQLNGEIAGAVGLGFNALGLLGGDNPTLRTIANVGGSATQVYQAIQSIQGADAALRAANASGDATQIANAGNAVASSIIGAINTGFGILGLAAGNDKTLQDVARYGGAATSVVLAALSPTPLAILGAAFGVISVLDIFDRKSHTKEITNGLDLTGNGSNDRVSFNREAWHYYYDVNSNDRGLKVDSIDFKLEKHTESIFDNADPRRNTRININEEKYFLSLDAHFAALFPGITGGETLSDHLRFIKDDETDVEEVAGGIELSKEQYDELVAKYGTQGWIRSDDQAMEAFRPFIDQLGNVRFIQTDVNQGMNFYLDVNADGILDRVQQFPDLGAIEGPRYEGHPQFQVNIRDAGGGETAQMSGDNLADISKAAAWSPYILSYIASHPDLIATFRTDVIAALPHFLEHGAERGITFDPATYLLANPDLINTFGSDTEAATRHFIANFSGDASRPALTVDTFLRHAAVQSDPAGVLQRLSLLVPSLSELALADPATATPRQTAEILNSLLQVAPQTAPEILEALAPGAAYRAATNDGTLPDTPNTPAPNAPNTPVAVRNVPDLASVTILGDRITTGELSANQAIQSGDGRYLAVMQADGNFVVYDYGIGHSIWATNTAGASGARLSMQSDGHVVVYDAANGAAWASGSDGSGVNRAFNLVMQSDGNLVAYDSQGGQPIWSSQGGLTMKPQPNA